MVQLVAVSCSVVRCAAVRCGMLQFVAVCHTVSPLRVEQPQQQVWVCCVVRRVCCSVLQCVAVCCSALQCVVVRYSVLQLSAVSCSELQCFTVICSVLHGFSCTNRTKNPNRYRCVVLCNLCVAVCCSVLQCVAVCCSVCVLGCTPCALQCIAV